MQNLCSNYQNHSFVLLLAHLYLLLPLKLRRSPSLLTTERQLAIAPPSSAALLKLDWSLSTFCCCRGWMWVRAVDSSALAAAATASSWINVSPSTEAVVSLVIWSIPWCLDPSGFHQPMDNSVPTLFDQEINNTGSSLHSWEISTYLKSLHLSVLLSCKLMNIWQLYALATESETDYAVQINFLLLGMCRNHLWYNTHFLTIVLCSPTDFLTYGKHPREVWKYLGSCNLAWEGWKSPVKSTAHCSALPGKSEINAWFMEEVCKRGCSSSEHGCCGSWWIVYRKRHLIPFQMQRKGTRESFHPFSYAFKTLL